MQEEEPGTAGPCGEALYWEYTDGKLIITGTGAMYEYGGEELPAWNVYGDLVTELHLPKEVEAIDLDAFTCLTALKEVYYGGTVSEWETVLFTGSADTFGDEITAEEIFAGARINFAQTDVEGIGAAEDGMDPADPSAESDVTWEAPTEETEAEVPAEDRKLCRRRPRRKSPLKSRKLCRRRLRQKPLLKSRQNLMRCLQRRMRPAETQRAMEKAGSLEGQPGGRLRWRRRMPWPRR